MRDPLLLPNEILFQIIEHVAPEDILDCRLISRTFKTAIDTYTLYFHLKQMRLIACLHPCHDRSSDKWIRPKYRKRLVIEFQFQHTTDTHGSDDDDDDDGNVEKQKVPQADRTSAVFKLSTPYAKPYQGRGARRADLVLGQSWWQFFSGTLASWHTSRDQWHSTKENIQWCVNLGDDQVFDAGIYEHPDVKINFVNDKYSVPDAGYNSSKHAPEEHIQIVITGWKYLVLNYLREARALKISMREKANTCGLSFGHEEDCRRYMRRQALERSGLKHVKVRADSVDVINGIPLWGQPVPKKGRNMLFEFAEDDAMVFIKGIESGELFCREKV